MRYHHNTLVCCCRQCFTATISRECKYNAYNFKNKCYNNNYCKNRKYVLIVLNSGEDYINRRMSMVCWRGKSLTIGNLTARLPIIQGGMGVGISLSGLASAIANAGGIGVISAAAIGMMESDFSTNYLEANIRALRKEIRKARELTKGILGINIMVALSNFADMARTAIEEGIDIIFSGAGLPLNLPSFVKESKVTKLVPIVSSA